MRYVVYLHSHPINAHTRPAAGVRVHVGTDLDLARTQGERNAAEPAYPSIYVVVRENDDGTVEKCEVGRG